jgi:hypothetical protein
MPNLAELLTPQPVELQDLLLDPNNPRFAELGEPISIVPEVRFGEERVQRDAFEKMKAGHFDVAELRDTIKTIGFLPMDRIVVRLWRGQNEQNKYLVVEGNRRVSALKWLIELHETGRETFTDEQLENFTRLEVLILNDIAPDSAKWILPGLRHVSGIKEWGAYQKARAVHILRETGSTPQEAAQSLGLATRTSNQLWRSYLALEQMSNDEEYGEYVEPKMYSYFEEVFKRPNVRDWLAWSDAERRFINQNHLKEYYSWMLGEITDDGDLGEPKLPEAKSIRELGAIIDDESAMAVFRSSGGNLARALARYEAEHPEDWKPIILQAQTVLASLSADALRSLATEDIEVLNNLKQRVERVLDDRNRLIGDQNV